MKTILELLEKDSKLTPDEIASMLNIDVADVVKTIRDYEEQKIILGYKTVIDWDRTEREALTALIEIRVAPQHEQGFERVAQRISQYDEVESVYLMSGGFDLTAIITGKTLKEVAFFVSDKLAPLKEVTATSTHFVLKKFKEQGVSFEQNVPGQERLTIL